MKTCTVENCVSPIWGKGYCQRHQYLRQDRKKPQRTLLKHSEKKPAHTIDWGFDDQTTLFGTLWEIRKDVKGQVICEYTGEKLNSFLFQGDLWYSCFAHLLSKGKYPYFKLNPANIAVVHPEFHRIVDQGTTKDREAHPDWKWDLWDAKVIQMKDEYIKFKKDNLLA
jgi:hypothetical protein